MPSPRPADVQTIAAGRTNERGPWSYRPFRDFAEAEAAWRALAADSDNVFSTFEWLHTWWRHFGRDRRLLLTGVVDGEGDLIAILPLYQAARRPLRVIRLIGHGATDQLGPVCAAGDRADALAAMARFLTEAGTRSWDVALADELPIAGTAGAPGARTLGVDQGRVAPLTGCTGQQWLATRPRKLRDQLRRDGRRLEALGTVGFRTTGSEAALDEDLDHLLRLHHLRWDPAGGSRAYAGREAFHHDVARTFLDRGWLRLRFLELDGWPVAALHSFRFDGTESHYQGGRDPAFDRCSVGLLLQDRAIRACADEGVREYRFLRGDEAYKARLADATVELQSVAWARGRRGDLAVAGLARLPRLSLAQKRWVPAPYAWGTGGSPRWGNP
ncbi:GNAT family N-acetyltransferase [Aquihabitans sp. McL0605]|uniref:GNAT family N-acetyltransferase n=1 Tax=Aquihabitans sp. McL0605 TaxID=3415671 RepID=UPI003CEB2642